MSKRRFNFGRNYRGYQGYSGYDALVARIAKIYRLPVWLIKGENK